MLLFFCKFLDVPDMFAKKAGKATTSATPEAVTYTSTGWLFTSVYSDGTCGTPSHGFGYAVDTCFLNNGFGFKYQLTGSKPRGFVLSPPHL